MFVAHFGNKFIPPYSELMRKTSDRFFEAGISQVYLNITETRYLRKDDGKLARTSRKKSSDDLNPSLDFSLDDPQGKITFYLSLIGLGLGLVVLWAEMAWTTVKGVGKTVYENTKRGSRRAYYATWLFLKSILGSNANNEGPEDKIR